MTMLHFEWDPQKDLTNRKKHGVSFAEASTVFEDVNALVISDPEHSEDEESLSSSDSACRRICSSSVTATEHLNQSFVLFLRGKQRKMKPDNNMKDEVRTAVKKEYDFSNARKNPYADKVKQQITINLNQSTVQYFKDLAEKTGLPYQTLINLYLTDCADKKRQPEVSWIPA